MSIPESFQNNFNTLLRAAEVGDLALMECTDAVTGALRYVICAVGHQDGQYTMTPFGHLHDGDPYKAYIPPAAGEDLKP